MPRRVTIDANGLVILVESVPERELPPKPKRGKISADVTKKFEWTEDKARKSSRKLFGARSSPGLRDSWISCSLCKSKVKERNLKKHLRKVHPAQFGHEPANASQLAAEPSNENQDQRERSVIDERSEYARKLLRELHEETKIRYGDKAHAASSGDTAPKGIKQHRDESRHPVDANVSKTGPTPSNRSIPKREAKKQAKSGGQGIAAKQKKAEKLRAEIKAIDKELKKLAPGFHRIKIASLHRKQSGLREELEKLERTLLGNAFAQGRFPGRAGRLGARTEQHKEDLLRERAENEYGGKYLGHMRRDYDGSFGSISLYDDYGEESFPN